MNDQKEKEIKKNNQKNVFNAYRAKFVSGYKVVWDFVNDLLFVFEMIEVEWLGLPEKICEITNKRLCGNKNDEKNDTHTGQAGNKEPNIQSNQT